MVTVTRVGELISCRMPYNILTTFYNVSIETQSVISDWKLSKVTSIYKGKGSKDDAGNYRPISLVGHTMKIFEK